MIPVSTEYVQNVYANVRQFKARVRVQFPEHESNLKDRFTIDFSDHVNTPNTYPWTGNLYRMRNSVEMPFHWNEFSGGVEPADISYNKFKYWDGTYLETWVSSGYYAAHLWSFDMIHVLTEKLGSNIFEKGSTLAEKISQAKKILEKITFQWIGRVKGPSNSTRAFIGAWSEKSQQPNFTNYTTPTNGDTTIYVHLDQFGGGNGVYKLIDSIDENGRVHFFLWGDKATSQGISQVFTDYVSIDIDVKNIKVFESDEIIEINAVEQISVLSDSIPANEASIRLSNETGELDFLSLDNMFSIIATMPKVWADLGLVLPDNSVEWVPIGTWFLSEWKNDHTSKIITLTANDWFSVLGEKPYQPQGFTNLYNLANSVLITGGVQPGNIFIDMNLLDYTVNDFPDIIDCRTALQHIGIAAQAAVGQDRYGNVYIKRFFSLDEDTNYLNYPTTQPNLFGYPGSGNLIINNTESGMKRIDQDYMFQPAQVSLERSIYQLVIKVHHGHSEGSLHEEHIYENTTIIGTNGRSFTIDNPLINSKDLADKVAEWYMREMNYNAVYNVNWRQNPSLEATDLILVEDPFGNEKQSRIIQQEFNYQGYLDGNTTTRGGV